MNVNVTRTVTIKGEGQQSLDSLAASVNKVTASEQKLAAGGQVVASVTDMVTKRQLSAADAYKRQTLMIDAAARSQDQFARQAKIADAALNQGRISADAHAARISLLKDKYGEASIASKAFGSTLEGLGKAFGAVIAAAGTLGLALSVGAMLAYGKSVFSTTADLQEQADQILGAGGNVEALQTLRGIFLTNGIAQEQGDKILQKLTRSLGEAEEGSKKAQDAFKGMGLGAKQLAGTSADAALPLVAKKLLDIQDATKRAALETAIFGKTGQALESALHALAAGSMSELIARGKDLGIVIDEQMIKKADDAKDKIAIAFLKIQTTIAPVVVDIADHFSKWADHIDQVTKSLTALYQEAKTVGGTAIGARIGFAVGGAPGAAAGAIYGAAVAGYVQGPNQAEVDYQTRLSQNPNVTAEVRAAAAKRALSYNNQIVGNTGLVTNDKRNGTESVTVTASRDSQPPWKPTNEDIAAYNKIKETYAGFLAELKEGARLATESSAQRDTELAVIKAAQIAQKEHNVATRDQVKNYADAAKYLGEVRVSQVEIEKAQERVNALGQQQEAQIKLINVGLAQDADHRALSVKNAQDELAAGVAVGAEYANQRAEIERKNAAIQEGQDATAFRDYLDNLKEEVKLAGMAADEREREASVIQAIHATHGKITEDQKNEVRGEIVARQEAERWRGVVDDISGGFQNFFEDVLNNGKLSFGSLWDSIKQSFVKMLAYMATQALVAPVIIPMVADFAGSLGLSGAAGLGGGSSALGLLSNAGSLSSLFGGGEGLGLGSLFGAGGLGGALGFGFSVAPTAGASVALGGGLGSISSGLPGFAANGSLFGGLSLGSFAGGVGLGSLASSLIFGNKNDASLGGLGGAAAGAAIGSIIPGVGTIIGGLIGGLAGGGLGSLTGSSNQGAISNFTNNGLGNTLFKAGGGNNGQLATTASGNINTALKALKDAGVDVSLGNISGLSIGSDKSYVYDFAGGKQKLAGGEAGVQATVNAILDRILPSASSSDDAVNALLQKYGTLNSGNLGAFSTELQAQKDQKAIDAAAKVADDLAKSQAEVAQAQADAVQSANELAQAQKDVADAQSVLTNAYTAQQRTIQDTISKYTQQATSLRDYLGQLTGSSGSSGAQYGIARANFAATAAQARAGDIDAMSRVQAVGETFLTASQRSSSTLSQYRADRAFVVNGVRGAADAADSAISNAQQQLTDLDQSVSALIDLNKNTLSVKEAIEKMKEALEVQGAKTEVNTAKIAKLLTSVTRDGESLLTTDAAA